MSAEYSTQTATVGDLIEGQIWRWRYKEDDRSYWCKSRIAVVKNGRLIDTYWSDLSSEHEVRVADVDLTFLCDQTWPAIRAWEVAYYDAADIADTRHANSSRASVYLRPGAQRSAAAILTEIEQREETARSEISMAQHRLASMAKARDLVAAGKLSEVSL